MKAVIQLIIFILLFMFITFGQDLKHHRYPFSYDSTLTVPLYFAPGLIKGTAPAFTNDGKTVYHHLWDGKHHTIMVSYFMDGNWTPSAPAEFSGKYDELEPFVSPDGKRVYFYSNHPVDNQVTGSNIVYVERINQGWSEPKALPAPINISGSGSGVPSFSKNGNLYFGSTRNSGKWPWEIFFSPYINGKFSEPVNITDSINKGYQSWSHCIAPDESFIIFCSERPDGIGGIDLYASLKENGKWTPAKNLGNVVNTKLNDVWPRLSPDGKYLFFKREEDKGSIYQIDVKPLLSSLKISSVPISPVSEVVINSPDLFYESEAEIHAISFDQKGLMYVGGKQEVFTITPDKQVKHFLKIKDPGSKTTIWSMVFGMDGNLYIAAHDRIIQVNKEGDQKILVQEDFSGPCGATDLRFDINGNLYVAYDNLVAKYDTQLNKTIFMDGSKFPTPIKWVVGLEFSADEKYVYLGDCHGSNAYVIPITEDNYFNKAKLYEAGFCQYFTRDDEGNVYMTLNDGRKTSPELISFQGTSYNKIFCSKKPVQNEVEFKKTIASGGKGFNTKAVYCIIGRKIYSYNMCK